MAEQTKLPHARPLALLPHVPGAVQTLGRLSLPTHEGAPQPVPLAQYAQAREPSHWPLVPQVLCACAAHSLSGSELTSMAPHTPSAPRPFFSALHASHVPAHAVSQQKPSTQLPDKH